MKSVVSGDVDFVAAQLHGRRGRIADGANLDALCRIKTVAELSRRIFGKDAADTNDSRAFQRRVIVAFYEELCSIEQAIPASAAPVIRWQRMRLHLQNFKILARTTFSERPYSDAAERMIFLREEIPFRPLKKYSTTLGFIDELISVSNEEVFRTALRSIRKLFAETGLFFFVETALDRAYFHEFVALADQHSASRCGSFHPIASREAVRFLLSLAIRGRWSYEIPAERLSPYFFEGSDMRSDVWDALLTATSLEYALNIASGAFLLPPCKTVARLEAACQAATLRESSRLFRSAHMGIGAIYGYTELRRTETANLITLSEGLRLGIDSKILRARMIPQNPSKEENDV